MALALSDFEALCGFAPLEELQHALSTVPELRDCVGEALAQGVMRLRAPDKQVLKQAFTALMTHSSDHVAACVQRLVERLQASAAAHCAPGAADAAAVTSTSGRGDDLANESQHRQDQQGCRGSTAGRGLSPKEALVLRLQSQFPHDVGVLSAFFLNYVTLSAGQVRGCGA